MKKQAMRQPAISKQTGVMAITAVLLLSVTIGYRMLDGAKHKTGMAETSLATTTENKVLSKELSDKAVVRTPDKGYIASSIDDLARQIVSSAPNQEEAFGFLIEAKSLRIQNLRARRTKERAVEEKARYDAELWHKKRSQIDQEIAQALEKDAIDTQAGSQAFYSTNGRAGHGEANQAQALSSMLNTPSPFNLNDFLLRAIIKEEHGYVARLSYQNKFVPAQTGYLLFGQLKVVSITAAQVVLSKDDEKVTLYAF